MTHFKALKAGMEMPYIQFQLTLLISSWVIRLQWHQQLGNVTGYPGVFPGNLHPYPSKPVPASTGAGFDKYGCRFCKNPRGYNPSTGAPSNTDRENLS